MAKSTVLDRGSAVPTPLRHDDAATPASFRQLVESTSEDRKRVRNLVARGQWRQAEPDPVRHEAFEARVRVRQRAGGAEAIVGPTNDLMGASFLAEGSQVRRAIGFVEVNTPASSTLGSGFLVSPRLFLTNFHVIGDTAGALAAQVVFDRETGPDGRPLATSTYLLAPDVLAIFSPVDELDYALIAVGRRVSGEASLSELGFCPLENTPDRHVIGMNVNIIQHPGGLPKMLSARNNLLTARSDRTLLYESDTEEGSSGSPVFNDLWDLVALHHWGAPYLERRDEDGQPIPSAVNEGVRISAIYADLQRRLDTLLPGPRALLEDALSAAAQRLAGATPMLHRRLGGARPNGRSPESVSTPPGRLTPPDATASGAGEVRLTVPLEITVRLGSPASGPIAIPGAPASPKTLRRAAEAKHLDTDYANRHGYDSDHIAGHPIPLPKPKSGGIVDGHVAALRATEPEAAKGVLKYEHFSVVIDRTKRMALFTATNVDGATYLVVDRNTGQVTGAPEGETWYKDPRISESFWTGQDFYSAWSIYFDRGHLTRRSDPTWGDDPTAERANADTFHFTNCSPQHFRFNETTPFWQGAERYVLENGVLAADPKKRISVFQGPIFDDAVDLFADDLQIPSSFWKVIVWVGAGGALRSVGLVVDQLSLLDEQRHSLGQPQDVPSVDVSQWRVSIAKIEERTGLDFGAAIRGADTITNVAQPHVGEAAVRLASLADILAIR